MSLIEISIRNEGEDWYKTVKLFGFNHCGDTCFGLLRIGTDYQTAYATALSVVSYSRGVIFGCGACRRCLCNFRKN